MSKISKKNYNDINILFASVILNFYKVQKLN
jgi:hypothetical protein